MSWETIKSRADFLRVQKSEIKWIRPGFIALALPRQQAEPATKDRLTHRMGYVVTKKLDKRATVRNRVKRRLRAMAQITEISQLAVPLDIVLIARPAAIVQDFAELQTDWQRAIHFFRSKFKAIENTQVE